MSRASLHLRRTCGKCRHCKKRKDNSFFCNLFGHDVFERSSAIHCENYGKYKAERYPID